MNYSEGASISFTNISNFPFLEDNEVEIIVNAPNYLLWMRYFGLQMLCKVVKSFVQKISEEYKVFQDCLVCLSQVGCLEGLRQLAHL